MLVEFILFFIGKCILIDNCKCCYFCIDRLRNGEKANDLVWESWGTTASESDGLGRESDIYGGGYDDEVIHKNKALSLPSNMRYGSLSIPPSPVLFATKDVSITRSKSDEANIGRALIFFTQVLLKFSKEPCLVILAQSMIRVF